MIKEKYTTVTNDSFGLFDENGLCRAWFSSKKSKQQNLAALNYEEYCCRISSRTLEYARERIESWYEKKTIHKKNVIKKRNEKIVPLYLRIGYL